MSLRFLSAAPVATRKHHRPLSTLQNTDTTAIIQQIPSPFLHYSNQSANPLPRFPIHHAIYNQLFLLPLKTSYLTPPSSYHRINLAYQELYLVLASIFRIFNDEGGGPKLELYDTTRERDIDMDADLGNPSPKAGSLGMRVRVVR